jgi:RimJ/RimL family protein N-acetyltransferase
MITQMPRAVPAMAGRADAGQSDENRVVLRDGSAIAIRPLTTGDVAAIAAWFDGLGPETRYARFLASVTILDDRTRWQLAQVDHLDHEALTAVTDDGAVVGIARYIRLPQASPAEVAVAVADHWRGRGIASLLLRQIAARARAAGIDCLVAVCLTSNTAILRLLSRLGPMTTGPPEAGVVEVRISLG